MKSLWGKLGVVLIGLIIFGYSEVWGADWRFYGGCENILGYFDAQNITHPSKNVVEVRVKWEFTKDGVLFMVREFSKKYWNLSYSINLVEINCAKKKTHFLSYTTFNNMGLMIESSSSSSEWRLIISESMNEALFEKVCK
jgi:hypothetical protein